MLMSDRFRNILYVKPGIVVVGRITEKAIEDVKHRKSDRSVQLIRLTQFS
jgi:hypothetical protein